jgi:dTDP-glucose pyrophosphorylase
MTLDSALLVPATASVREALEAITKNGRQAVLVTDPAGRLVGLVTDGDLRRAMLRGVSLDDRVPDVMNARPVTGDAGLTRDEAIALMQQRRIRHLPLIDAERRLVDVLFLDELLRPAPLPNAAVIMAGGAGRRLAPLTETTPKPLLRVGGKPLLEIMIERLRQAGIHDVFMTLHYKSQMIADHCGDGGRFGVNIHYHYEAEPRGTAGSLRDLHRDYPESLSRPFLLVNADILTKCDFRRMFEFHEEHQATMTVGTVPYTVDLPYGILDVDGPRLAGVTEKPRLDFVVNSGIYIVSPLAVQLTIPIGGVVDVPQIIESLIRLKRRVVAFPIREYWLDVGRHDDFHKADRDVAEGLLE